MTPWSRLKSLGRNLFRRSAVEKDLDDEVRSYVEMLADEHIEAGTGAEEARRITLAEFGGAERLKQSVREERAGSTLGSIVQDLRFGFRQVARAPGFSFIVILTLALSIGITSTVFSVLYAMLIHPLPYHDVKSLLWIPIPPAAVAKVRPVSPEYAGLAPIQ